MTWIPAPPGTTSTSTNLKNQARDVVAIDPDNGLACTSWGTVVGMSTCLTSDPLQWVPAADGWRACFGILGEPTAEEDRVAVLPVVAFRLPLGDDPNVYASGYAVADPSCTEVPVIPADALHSSWQGCTQGHYLVPPGAEPPLARVRAELADMRAAGERSPR